MRKAENNYFGTDDPEVIKEMVFDKSDDMYVHERIHYEPFLEEPHPDTPTEPQLDAGWCSEL